MYTGTYYYQIRFDGSTCILRPPFEPEKYDPNLKVIVEFIWKI